MLVVHSGTYLTIFVCMSELGLVRQIEPKLNRDARGDSNVGDDWTLASSARSRIASILLASASRAFFFVDS